MKLCLVRCYAKTSAVEIPVCLLLVAKNLLQRRMRLPDSAHSRQQGGRWVEFAALSKDLLRCNRVLGYATWFGTTGCNDEPWWH